MRCGIRAGCWPSCCAPISWSGPLLPLLTATNLELDLAEDLALGKEWQLGYWKHPPLPWWLADLVYRLTGQINSVYLLGPLAVIACFVGVYLLARDIAGPAQALIATLSLIGIHYYNYSAVKFAHDQMQLPFWAFTALFFYRALARGRDLGLVAGRRHAGAGLLVQICSLRARDQPCGVPDRRSAGAADAAHARVRG